MAKPIRHLLMLFLMGFAINVYGQRYRGSEIIRKADSAVISVVGKRIFEGYYYLDPLGTYYTYKNFWGHKKYGDVRLNKKTKGKLIEAFVRYSFCLMQSGYTSSSQYVRFEYALKISASIDTSFIPKYVLHNTPNNFITDSMALSIAKKNLKKKGVRPLVSYLGYDREKKRYLWKFDNITEEYFDQIGTHPFREIETLEFDAISGAITKYDPNDRSGVVY
jgi:hypothetical protein